MNENEPKRLLGIAWTAYAAGALAAGAMAIGFVFIGANLGLLFLGIAIALILVAPLSLAESRLLDRLIIAAAAVDGVAAVWVVAVIVSPITFVQWLLCYAILIGWAIAIVGLAHLLDRLLRNPVPASAIVVVLGLAWLTSPVWLKMRAPAVVPVHPLMAINGVVRQFGPWTERPIAYKYLFNLGQDVPYELPRNIAGFLLVHGGVGLLALAGARFVGKR